VPKIKMFFSVVHFFNDIVKCEMESLNFDIQLETVICIVAFNIGNVIRLFLRAALLFKRKTNSHTTPDSIQNYQLPNW
jgi:hypothetical protein